MSGDPTENAGVAAEVSDAIDPAVFESTLSPADLALPFRPGEILSFPWLFPPIDTISPTRTVGAGRTNLTLIASDILQTDTTGTPYASFTYRQVPSGGPGVSVHFDPGAYGATGAASYVVSFLVQAYGPVTLSVSGYAGPGSVTGVGTRSVNGQVSVTVGLKNVPASQITYAAIQQTSGASWAWYRTTISHPPLVITL